MPQWEDCLKIHENCGGLVRWVEAVHDPHVGYYGNCLACGLDDIVVEQIIPIKEAKPEAGVILEKDSSRLADLEWDDDASWNENQERLKEEVKQLL